MEVRYWDASAFIAHLNEEEGRVKTCEAVLDMARRGELLIATSAVTLTEVVKLKGERPIGRDKATTIRGFFKHEWISKGRGNGAGRTLGSSGTRLQGRYPLADRLPRNLRRGSSHTAHLGRQWIGIDVTYLAIALIRRRLTGA